MDDATSVPIRLSVTAEDTSPASPSKKQDAVIDVLLENQRGAWLCGLPRFSSASLLHIDGPAWRNGHGHESPVSVVDAQTPDPSWKWAWPTWYVDMSRDVDEEGWQYSFMFRRKTAWHGSHPWHHSFVRRRRWIRKRVKGSHPHASELQSEGRLGKLDAHKLNADYFAIHNAKTLAHPESIAPSVGMSRYNTHAHNEDDDATLEVDNMGSLLKSLRKAKIDREKASLVLRFLDEGGEDVYYLADEMSHILSMFLYQYTRRQLLTRMLEKIRSALDHRDEHQRREREEPEEEKKRTDNLLRATNAAEAEIRALEYWSDIRDVVQNGQTVTAVDEKSGWRQGWQGLDISGASQAEAPKTDEHGRITDKEARTAGSSA